MYLPGLLSQLEGWTTCGAGTGITSGSGMTMEDSGAIEYKEKVRLAGQSALNEGYYGTGA